MSVLIPENDLPVELTKELAVESAYTTELAEVASKLQRGLPALIECDKDLAGFVYMNLKARMKSAGFSLIPIPGAGSAKDAKKEPGIPAEPAGGMPVGLI